jgi:hypothetical protein
MLCRVALVRADVSEEHIASINNVTRIGVQRVSVGCTANVVSSSPSLVALKMEVILSFDTSVLTRATLRNIPEDGIFLLHSRI